MSYKSSNVPSRPSSLVYFAIAAGLLRVAEASNNPESFSTAIKPLLPCMSRQGVSIGVKNSSIINFFKQTSLRF